MIYAQNFLLISNMVFFLSRSVSKKSYSNLYF